MKYAFIITSAINSKFGTFNPKQRFDDTLETIKSINQCVPGADTYLMDMCGDPLTLAQKEELSAKVTMISDYSSDPEVQKFYQIPSQDIVKNLTEMLCFGHFMTRNPININTGKTFGDYDRIFKISGRYKLNPNVFKIQDYQIGFPGLPKPQFVNKMIFSGVYNSQFDPKVTGNDADKNYQFMSRLWSFDPSLVNIIAESYANMLTNMVERLNKGGYIDIEHLLYKHMPKEHIVVKTPVGLIGGIAPNGQIVND